MATVGVEGLIVQNKQTFEHIITPDNSGTISNHTLTS